MEDQLVEDKIRSKFGQSILKADKFDMLCLEVEKNSSHDIVKFLKEDSDLQFTFLTTLCGLHYPGESKPIGIMIQLHNLIQNKRIRIKTFTEEEPPTFKTFTDLFSSANWMERETYDFFGVEFEGHPDLRRILNMDSMVGWPLRKEYPLEDQDRFDKDDKMFGR